MIDTKHVLAGTEYVEAFISHLLETYPKIAESMPEGFLEADGRVDHDDPPFLWLWEEFQHVRFERSIVAGECNWKPARLFKIL